MKRSRSVVTYMVLVAAVLLSKVFGLLRGILLSQFYGTGMEASVFKAVSNLPLILFDITLGTAISAAFVPVFNEKLSKEGDKSANKFASNFLNIVLLFSLVIVIVGILFPELAVTLVANGFNKDTGAMTLASELMRIIMPIMCFACCTFVFIGVLQSYGEFVAPALVSLLSNLAMIVYLLVFNRRFGIHGLAVAFCIGWFLQFTFLTPFLKKKKFNYSFTLNILSNDIKKVAILTLPLFVSSLAQPINQLISSNLSSSVSLNSTATVGYAYDAYFIVAGVFSYALTNMFFPEMSRKFASDDVEGATVICKDMLSTITNIIMPIMAFLCSCSQPVIRILYQRGAFNANDTVNVSVLLSVYALGMLFLSWQDILNKYFYSMQKSYIPMISAFIGIISNVVLSVILLKAIGLKGLAVSTVISGAIMTVILCGFAAKFTNVIFKKDFFIEIAKTLIGGIAIFVVCKLLLNVIDFNTNLILQIVYVIIILLISLLIYVMLMALFKSASVIKLFQIIKKGGKTA